MVSKLWKASALTLAVGIIVTFAIANSFHGYSDYYFVHKVDGNGTLIVAGALKGFDVNGKIVIQYTGQEHGPVNVTFANGTEITVTSPTTLYFHFNGKLFLGETTGPFAPFGMNLSGSHPFESLQISNYSFYHYQSSIAGYKDAYVNYFFIYLHNYALVTVTLAGVGL